MLGHSGEVLRHGLGFGELSILNPSRLGWVWWWDRQLSMSPEMARHDKKQEFVARPE